MFGAIILMIVEMAVMNKTATVSFPYVYLHSPNPRSAYLMGLLLVCM